MNYFPPEARVFTHLVLRLAINKVFEILTLLHSVSRAIVVARASFVVVRYMDGQLAVKQDFSKKRPQNFL